jgi:multiple sugar transport system substrate-binding protein
MKKLATMLAAFALVAAMGMPVFAQAKPVELRFTVWTGNEAHLKMLNGIAAKYTAAHPNVTVKFDTIPYGDYPQKVALQLAGSNPPDAGWITEADATSFIAAKSLLDVSKNVAAYDFNDFSKGACELWVRDKAVYGVPFSTSPLIILYNKSLFAKAGVKSPADLIAAKNWTWQSFSEISRDIKAKTGVYGFQTLDGTGYTDNLWSTLVPVIRAYGGDVWNDKGVCTIASLESVQAVTLIHSMIYKDKSIVPPGEQADFFSGNAAMTISQISRVSKLKDAGFEWSIAPLPKGPAGEAQVIGQAAVVAFKASKHQAEAADFVAFMTNKENVATMTQFFPPARVSVLDSDAFTKGNPLIAPEIMSSAVGYSLKNGRILPSHVNIMKINLVARSSFDKLWRADADVAKVLKDVSADISPLLKTK